MPSPAGVSDAPKAREWADELESIHEQDRAELVRGWYRALRSPEEVQSLTFRSHTAQGWRLHELKSLNLLDQHGYVVLAIFDRGPGDPAARPVATDDLQVEAPAGAIQMLDTIGCVQRTEGMVLELFGRTAEEMQGQIVLEFIHPDDHEAALAMWLEVLDTPGSTRRIRQRLVHPDGTHVWIESAIVNQLHVPGIEAMISVSQDVGRRMGAEHTLRERAREFALLAEEVPIAMFRADHRGRVTFANSIFWDLFDPDCEAIGELGPEVAAAWLDMLAGEPGSSDCTMVDRRGRTLNLRWKPVFGEDHTLTGVVGTMEDVTAEVERHRELEERSHSDALTGLTNRWVIERELERLDAEGAPFGVIFVDLDGLKRLNDDFGHDAGDTVLKAVADRMRSVVRPGDVVSRWGGDEFVVVAPGLTLPQCEALADRLQLAVAHDIVVDTGVWSVRVSTGAAARLGGEDPSAVMARADAAMYQRRRKARAARI